MSVTHPLPTLGSGPYAPPIHPQPSVYWKVKDDLGFDPESLTYPDHEFQRQVRRQEIEDWMQATWDTVQRTWNKVTRTRKVGGRTKAVPRGSR